MLSDALFCSGDGKVSLEELKAAMKEESEMMIFRGRKLGTLLLKLEKEDGQQQQQQQQQQQKMHVELAEFAEGMAELFKLNYKAFFRSQDIVEVFAEALWQQVASKKGQLHGELQHFHPLKHLASLDAAEREKVLTTVLRSCEPELVKKMSESVDSAAKYKAEQSDADSQRKYNGMVLGDVLCFDAGIDVLGMPSLDFQAAIEREHMSEEEFKVLDDVPALPDSSTNV